MVHRGGGGMKIAEAVGNRCDHSHNWLLFATVCSCAATVET